MSLQSVNNLLGDEEVLKDIEDLLSDDDAPVEASAQQAEAPVVDPTAVLTEELKRLREEIKDVKQQPAEQTEQAGIEIDIPELDEDKLGKLADYKDQLETIAKHATGSNLKAVVDEVNKLKKELEETRKQLQQASQSTFATTLRAAIPDIDTLHRQPEFANYLKQKAPFSGGRTLADLLDEAYRTQDLARVREIIDGYKTNASDASEEPVAPSRPNVKARQTTQAQTSTADTEDSLVEAGKKLIELFQRRKISYEKFLELKQKLDAKRAGLITELV